MDGRLFEVMAFIPGTDYNPQCPEQQISMGTTLARYHKLVRCCAMPPETPPRRYSPQNILALTEILLERDYMGDFTDLLFWYDLRTSHLRKLVPDSKYERLPHLVIHGDIHCDNVLFDHDQVVALLDFDQIAWDSPLADLADALVAFTSVKRPKILTWGVFPGPLDEERAKRLMAGYARVSAFSPDDITALPVILELLWLQSELGRVVSTPEGSSDYHREVLEQGRQLSVWLEEHRQRLTAEWMSFATE